MATETATTITTATTATAAAGTTATTDPGAKSGKNFRSSVDIENFYRFIHENDLRRETITMLEFVHSKLAKPKKRGRKKKIQ